MEKHSHNLFYNRSYDHAVPYLNNVLENDNECFKNLYIWSVNQKLTTITTFQSLNSSIFLFRYHFILFYKCINGQLFNVGIAMAKIDAKMAIDGNRIIKTL